MTTSAQATSTYGSFAVQSSTTFDISGTPNTAYSFAIGDFSDTLTVSLGPLNGQTGFMSFDYAMDGGISKSGSADSFVQLGVEVAPPESNLSEISHFATYTSSLSGKFSVPKQFSFTYGQPTNIYFCLGATTGLGIIPAPSLGGHLTNNVCSPGPGLLQTGNGTGTANFSWTLSGITLTDSAGNPVNNATFASASGAQYGPNGVVPEPSTLTLFGLALLGLAGRGCRHL